MAPGVIEVQVPNEVAQRHVHWLPCGLQPPASASTANVSLYFDNYVSGSGAELKASFRGRELDGEKFPLPQNYEAYVLNEIRQPLSDEADRKFHVDGKFKEMTYWNWNKQISKNDAIQRAMEWIDLADVLHEPINIKAE